MIFLVENHNGVTEDKVDELAKELDSVAIDWKGLRGTTECSCSSSFDHLSKKVILIETKWNIINLWIFLEPL